MKTKSKKQIEQQILQQRLWSLDDLKNGAEKRILAGKKEFIIRDRFGDLYVRCGSGEPAKSMSENLDSVKGIRDVIDRLLFCPVPSHKTDMELMETIVRLVEAGWRKDWEEIQEAREEIERDRREMEEKILKRIKSAIKAVRRGQK